MLNYLKTNGGPPLSVGANCYPVPRHPAKYSDVLLPVFIKALEGHERILDPFAGTGKLRLIRPDAFLLEIEPEWAEISGATVGDALAMPWDDGTFDAVCTSPTYGNRMADHFIAQTQDTGMILL